MDRITPNVYIQLQKKICNPLLINTIVRKGADWGIKPVEAAYRLLTDAVMKEHARYVESKK